MNEATKTRSVWTEMEWSLLRGRGIDIGCGRDPLLPEVLRFDLEHGDANVITEHVEDTFDFVFSAHCLEHMRCPRSALQEWWKLVKPGGHLIVIVPDQDLYEQRIWPSLFNADHKATFTMAPSANWSGVSVNVFELASSLSGGDLLDVRLQDLGYERSYLRSWRCPRWWARLLVIVRWKLVKWFHKLDIEVDLKWFAPVFQAPIDQTIGGALAQIQLVVRKRPV